MAAETARLPIGRPPPRTSNEAAELPEVEAEGFAEVAELGEGVVEVEFELPTRDESAGTVLKLALTEVPLVQEPGDVLAPATKLTAAH